MTKFTKENLVLDSEYISYKDESNTVHFIARCKYGRGKSSFVTFLKKNFTPGEYLARLTSGEKPLPILQSKGYIQPHIRKMLKEQNLPITKEGFATLIDMQVKGTQWQNKKQILIQS